MAKSQQSFNKKEKEKKRRKRRQEKLERREERKLEKEEAGKKTLDDMIMYVDEDGNLTSEKPDPTKKKKEINAEDIMLGVPSREELPEDKIKKGIVKFFNDEKGYGFIIENETKDSIFVHINNVSGEINEGNLVQFETELGQKGLNAVKVKLYVPEKEKPAAPVAEEGKEGEEKKEATDTPAAETEAKATEEAPKKETEE